jgi:hypothetical protein
MNEQEKRAFCAYLLEKYGITLSPQDELLGVYYLAYKTHEKCLHTCEELTRQVSQMKLDLQGGLTFFITKLEQNLSRTEPQQLRFGGKWEAFWYGLGSKGIAWIVGIIALSICCCYYLSVQDKSQKNEFLTSFIDKAGLQEKNVNKSQGVYLIKLYQATSLEQAREGTHYVYNESCKCIEVPITFKAK